MLEIASAYGLEEVEVRREGLRCCVRLLPGRRGEATVGIKEETSPSSPVLTAPREEAPPPEEAHLEEELLDVTAPMTGVFYRAPAVGAPPYVEVGDFVEKGQTLCLIEAMKVFNEIPAPASGVVVEILAQNETLVTQGEILFRIKPSSTEGERPG